MSSQLSSPVKGKKRCRSYMPSPKSLANLKPYKKGENGHQGGYPLKERLMHSLDKPLKTPDKQSPVGDHIVYSTLRGAILREPTPFKEVWDRVEGKMPDIGVNVRDVKVVFVIGKGYRDRDLPQLKEGANGNHDKPEAQELTITKESAKQ